MNKYLDKNTKIGKIVNYITNNPWKILITSIFLIALMFPALETMRTDTSYRVWVHEDDPLLKEFDAFERKFGNDDSIIVMVHSESGIFDKDSVELLQNMTEDMWQVHDVMRVDSLTNYNWVHASGDNILVDPLLEPEDGQLTKEFLEERKRISLSDESIVQYLVSKDGKAAMIYAALKPALVSYKKSIKQFALKGMVKGKPGSFNKALNEALQKNNQDNYQVLEKIKKLKTSHYLGIVKLIDAEEKRTGRALSYDKVVKIVERLGKVKFKEKRKTEINTEQLLAGDLKDLFTVLEEEEKNKSVNYEILTNEIKDLKAKYEDQSDHKIYLSGLAYLTDSFRVAMINDMMKIIPLVMIMVIGFLFVTFKKIWGFKKFLGTLQSAKGVIYSLVIVVTSIIFTYSIMAALGIKFTNMTSMVPQIMIAVCIADAVHILVTFFQFLAKGVKKREAVFISLTKNFIPTLLTSLTTALGFFCLSISKVAPMAYLGIVSGIGLIVTWIFSYSILGPLLVILPAKVKLKKSVSQAEIEKESIFVPGKISVKFVKFIDRRRTAIISLFSVIIVIGVALCTQLEVNNDPFNMFRKGSEVRSGLEAMEKHIGGAVAFEVNINSGKAEGIKEPQFLKRVEEYQKWIDNKKDKSGKKYVTKTVSIINILKQMNKTLHGGKEEFYRLPDTREEISQELFLYTMNLPQGMNINDRVTIKNDAIRMTVMVTLHDSKTQLEEFAAFEQKAKEMGLDAVVTGKQKVFMSIQPYLVQTFIISIISAFVLMSVVLIFALKSVQLGLLAMLPNIMPLMLGAAFVKLSGYDLDMGHILNFSICIGIAVDDTIHFLTNHRDNLKQGLSVNESIAKVFSFTVPALVTTTIVLVVSFGMFIMGSFVPNVNFGILTAFILGIALIADLTFLPALLIVLGNKFSGKDQKVSEVEYIPDTRKDVLVKA